jgi:hypothetical protein
VRRTAAEEVDVAISPTDRYYKAEVVPQSVKDLGGALCSAYGRPATAFGAKGNLAHDSGYHRSRAWVLRSPDSQYKTRDYSVLRDLDKGGDEDWVSAFDFTPDVWGSKRNRELMAQLTGRVYAAAKARDPRVAVLREFAGTLDGRNVITFNCADGSLKSPFDASHLDHGHGSLWRALAANDHGGLVAVMLGTGDDMPLTQAEKDEIVYRTATIVLKGVQPAGWADQTAPEPYRGQLRGAATNAAIADTLTALGAGLKAIAAKVDVDPEELAAIQAAAREGALSAGEGLAAAVIAALPEGERITKADVEQAIRSVLGGLDGATPA